MIIKIELTEEEKTLAYQAIEACISEINGKMIKLSIEEEKKYKDMEKTNNKLWKLINKFK